MPGTQWTNEQLDLLKAFISSGPDPRDHSLEIPGKTRSGIVGKALRLGLIQKRQAPKPEWPLKQRKLLKKAKADGLTPEDVFRNHLLGAPHRSLWSIKKKWGRMLLSDKKLRRATKKKRLWKPGERELFQSFLREHSQTMHPEEIATHWNLKVSTVRSAQLALGVAPGRLFVLKMPYNQQLKVRRRKAASRKTWQVRHKKRLETLLSLAEEMRSGSKQRPECECEVCGRSWPHHSTFFAYSAKKRYKDTTMITQRLTKKCRLCYGKKKEPPAEDQQSA